jgi:hypothetical protein
MIKPTSIVRALKKISENKTDTAAAVSEKKMSAVFTAEREDGTNSAPVDEFVFLSAKYFITLSSVKLYKNNTTITRNCQ